MFIADLDELRQRFKTLAKARHEPLVWLCPCGAEDCRSAIVYVRGDDDGILFTCTMHSTPNAYEFRVDNIEDFDTLLRDENIPEDDRLMYALWFQLGLREAILACPKEPQT